MSDSRMAGDAGMDSDSKMSGGAGMDSGSNVAGDAAPVIAPITVIAASAGTGKTYRLSREYLNGLGTDGRDRSTIHPHVQNESDIMATTFTNKAADELVERVRRVLLEQGQWHAAQGVLSGYLGTVNAICGRLLSEHAIDAGLSPDLTVIGEDRLSTVFAIAVDSVIHEFAEEMHEAAKRLQLENWQQDVQEIIANARNNNINAEMLESLAEESWNSLRVLLPFSEGVDGDRLDSELATAIDTALPLLPAVQDGTVATLQIIDNLGEVSGRLKSGAKLVWQSWAKLSKLSPGKNSREVVQPIIDAASEHLKHPRLHRDLETMIFGVFRCAAAAMQKYADYKKEHGLIDFVDQELLTLQMLRKTTVSDSLKERIRLLLVDEFQDTSPIQLSIFLELAKLVEYSVWVGDEKQSIFGFRGSDPELMRKASSVLVTTTGGKKDQLSKSYRSRPSLVEFTNAVFSKCDELRHITANSATIDEVDRKELEEQNRPLHFWWLQGQKNEPLSSLAQGVADVIANSGQWQVLDRETRELRPIAGSDIAILCRTNDSRTKVAKALVAQGLTVATERDALLETPECVLACAALRTIVDDSDTLAIAELVNLLMPGDGSWLNHVLTMDGGTWLEKWIDAFSGALDTGEQSGSASRTVLRALTCLQGLKELRSNMADRTPSEILESAINCPEVLETIMSWGNVRQRLANLDSLRGLARSYEDICRSAKTAATASGLIVHLYKFVKKGGSQPANPDENGIHILTYHKAKGLEWPMVIMFDLDKDILAGPFGISVESTVSEIDPLNPLAGRSIRYWPWPFGTQRKLPFAEKAGRTVPAKNAARRSTAELTRLLYVGITRARDYLVFAARPTSYGTAWLKKLTDKEHNLPLLDLPYREQKYDLDLIDGAPQSNTCFMSITPPEQAPDVAARSQLTYGARRPAVLRPIHPPYFLQPSEASSLDFTIRFSRPEDSIANVKPNAEAISQSTADGDTKEIGPRIPLSGTPDMQRIGDSVHAFLGIDISSSSESLPANSGNLKRVQLAATVLSNFEVDNIRAEELPAMADRLIAFLKSRYPEASFHTEMPVSGRLGLRRIKGSIDLLLEVPEGFVIVDHKTFPGEFEQWHARALSYAPQLALYRHVVEQATEKKVVAQFIHMPIVGAIIEVSCEIDCVLPPVVAQLQPIVAELNTPESLNDASSTPL